MCISRIVNHGLPLRLAQRAGIISRRYDTECFVNWAGAVCLLPQLPNGCASAATTDGLSWSKIFFPAWAVPKRAPSVTEPILEPSACDNSPRLKLGALMPHF